MNNIQISQNMRNKATHFTRSEGGTIVPVTFEVYEDELNSYTEVEKKEVFSKVLKTKIKSRVVKIVKIYVHALFFEDGKIYNVDINGFKLRELEREIIL